MTPDIQADIAEIAPKRVIAPEYLTEPLISFCYHEMMMAGDEKTQRKWCDQMGWWIGQRRPQAAQA